MFTHLPAPQVRPTCLKEVLSLIILKVTISFTKRMAIAHLIPPSQCQVRHLPHLVVEEELLGQTMLPMPEIPDHTQSTHPRAIAHI